MQHVVYAVLRLNIFSNSYIVINKKSDFSSNLANTLLSANIPLYKVNNFKFKEFLENFISTNIPYESTLKTGFIKQLKYKLKSLTVILFIKRLMRPQMTVVTI